jgi:SPP1 gp7 family putative phage head morphogenesis protein
LDAYYGKVPTKFVARENVFDEAYIIQLAESIYSGLYSGRDLPTDVYNRVLDYLTNGMYTGLQKVATLDEVRRRDPFMITKLRQNLQYFSAGKTYRQVRDVAKLINTPKGLRSRSDFLDKALPLLNDYNRNYLGVEYDAVVGQSQSASAWLNYETDKELLPFLKYVTAGDSNVRPEHAALNGIVRRVDDKFWDRYMPLNGWGCRCDVVQLDEAEESDMTDFADLTNEQQPPIFQFNAGKRKQVFGKSHPYFYVPKEDKTWAQAGYGLFTPTNE